MLTNIFPELQLFDFLFCYFTTRCRVTEMLSCPLEVARQMTLIAHGKNILCMDPTFGIGSSPEMNVHDVYQSIIMRYYIFSPGIYRVYANRMQATKNYDFNFSVIFW